MFAKKIIDEGGVERYQGNRLVEYMVMQNVLGKLCDINTLRRYAYHNGITRNEMRQFYKMMSYSISGYNDIDFNSIPITGNK